MKAEISWVPKSSFSSFEEQRGPTALSGMVSVPFGFCQGPEFKSLGCFEESMGAAEVPAGLGTRAWGGRDAGQG